MTGLEVVVNIVKIIVLVAVVNLVKMIAIDVCGQLSENDGYSGCGQ